MVAANFVSVTGFVEPAQLRQVPLVSAVVPSHRAVCGIMLRSPLTERPEGRRLCLPLDVASGLAQAAVDLGLTPVAHLVVPRALGPEHLEADLAALWAAGFRGVQIDTLAREILAAALPVLGRAPTDAILIVQVNEVVCPDAAAVDETLQWARSLLPAGRSAYALLDRSGGKGRPLDLEIADTFVQACRQPLAGFAPVLAGGLTPENVGDVFDRLGLEVSVDSQSGVQSPAGDLDPARAAAFFAAAAAAIAARAARTRDPGSR